jgi:hypothetical protein
LTSIGTNALTSEENKSSGLKADGSSKKKWRHHKKRHVSNQPTVRPENFHGGKEELGGGGYFECTGYGQSGRFMKTVQKIADHIGQEYKGGGIAQTEVMTQTSVIIQAPTKPVGISVTSADGLTTTTTPPDVLDISDYQSAKKVTDYQVQNQSDNCQKVF